MISSSDVSARLFTQVMYPAGSYGGKTGGGEIKTLWPASQTSPSNQYQSVLLSYEVGFPQGFAFVKGGKLPGLRGGPNTTYCSGGLEADGSNCFSVRLMWRTAGAGEAYAYALTDDGICNEPSACSSFSRRLMSRRAECRLCLASRYHM